MKTHLALFLTLTALTLVLGGCAGNMQTTAPKSLVIPAIHGSAYGGEQPIVGADLHMYAAGTSGYGMGAQDLMSQQVLTGPGGNFTLTGMYTCTPGQMLYLVAEGGDPGAGTNAHAVLMTALGDCATLTASTFIIVNEVTTVAAAYALSPFATSYAGIGTSPTNVAGLQRAFASAAKLTDSSVGHAGGRLPPGAIVPVAKLNTLANILAACVNSGGDTSAASSCGKLFGYTTVNNVAPTDTFGAALSIAQHPSNQVTALLGLVSPQSAFAPQLATAPHDWSLAIVYTGAGLNSPSTATVDSDGHVWIANAGNNTVTVLAQTGDPLFSSPLSGNGMNKPSAVAIDAAGNAWVANMGGNTVSVFTASGGTFATSPFTVASAPSALAVGVDGHVYVANQSSNSVSELTAEGSLVRTYTTSVSSPGSIVVNPK